MERWTGRVAVVSGASAGIGAAIAYQLQDHGLNVVALARRVEKVEEAVNNARKDAKDRHRYQPTSATPGTLYPRQCDVQKEEDILAVFKWVSEKLGKVDILVNNAGVVGEGPVTEASTSDWRRIIDTNLLGLSICTREAVKIMREKGVQDGHIVHISSVAGHMLPMNSGSSMYFASKHGVRALTEGLRKDFLEHKEKYKVTSVSPGVVHTDIVKNSPHIPEEAFYSQPNLFAEDVADAVTFALSTPPHVQIHEIIIKPIGEAF